MVKVCGKMDVKYILMVFLLGIVMFVVFLYTENPSEDQIMSRMASSVDDVSFYGFDINITLKNTGYRADRYLDIKMIINGIGRVDIKNKIAKFTTDVDVSSNDLKSRSYSEKGIDVYVVNDTIYTLPFGMWIKNKVQPESNLWNNQTHIRQQVDIMKNSKIKLIGGELINGVMTYHLDIEPDRNTLVEYVLKSGGTVSELNYERIGNLTNIITALNMDLWVSKIDYLPVKSVVYIETYTNNITADMTVVTDFYDYNKKSGIELPDLSNAVEIRD